MVGNVDNVGNVFLGRSLVARDGDIIIQMGDAKIENIQDYMKVLGQHKKGDQIEVIVQRGDSRERMLVTF